MKTSARWKLHPLACLLGLALALLPTAGRADLLKYELSLGNLLNLNPANGPYSLDFALTYGGGSESTTATMHGASYLPAIGGGVTGPAMTTGNASGDLAPGDTATLISGAGGAPPIFNDLNQQMFPATSFFDIFVDIQTNPGLTPLTDEFSFSVLDKNGLPIPTSDPSGTDTLLTVDVNGNTLTPHIYTNADVGSPTFKNALAPVPEPGSVVMLTSGAVILAGFGWRRRRAA